MAHLGKVHVVYVALISELQRLRQNESTVFFFVILDYIWFEGVELLSSAASSF